MANPDLNNWMVQKLCLRLPVPYIENILVDIMRYLYAFGRNRPHDSNFKPALAQNVDAIDKILHLPLLPESYSAEADIDYRNVQSFRFVKPIK